MFTGYYNPELVDQCGGVGMLLNKILDCHQYPRINESLVCTVLHLLNHPKTRHFIHINTGLEVRLRLVLHVPLGFGSLSISVTSGE